MTHFVVFVIIPKRIYNLGENVVLKYIDEVMEKYSEHTEVEPYIVFTKEEAEERYQEYQEHYKDTESSITKYFEESCYNIDINGNVTSTSNKESFHDGYVIGGRWAGLLKGRIGTESLEDNSIKIAEYLSMEHRFEPGIIIIDGKAISGREYAWLGVVTNIIDEKDWIEKLENIFQDKTEDYIVLLNCHV